MPRQPRYFIPDLPQHLIQRGVDRQAVFFEPSDYVLYRECLLLGAQQFDCSIHAYVQMTNHTHLFVTPGDKRSIPLLMQAMGRTYVQSINRKYGRTGTLWQGRYKASLVQDDRYLLACHRYIELNPVRAHMVQAPGDYPHSSFACNALGGCDPLITKHSLYESLSNTHDGRLMAYRNLFADEFESEMLALIRTTTNACRVLGGDRFKKQIAGMLGRSVEPGKSGRPAKSSG